MKTLDFRLLCFGMVVVLSLLATNTVAAGKNAGNCSSYDLSRYLGDPDGKPTTLIRHKAPLYKNYDGEELLDKPMKFGQRLVLFNVKGDRASVKYKDQDYGWVNLGDLLCGNQPLENTKNGLSRKAFIRTSARDVTNKKGQERDAKVWSFPSPSLDGCVKQSGQLNSCRQLTRFALTYVFDETPDAVLLGNEYYHETSKPKLFGWVEKRHVLMWDHAGGIRGKENLKRDDGEVGTICGYPTEQAAYEQKTSHCQPILGGNSWFKSPWRLPILEEPRGGVYKVVAASTGFAGGSSKDGKVILTNPDYKSGPDVKSVANNLDVFFVIDGTLSMLPHIEGIRGSNNYDGVVGKIKRQLQDKAMQGVQYRFGFRVYTDTQEGNSGLGDGYVLDGTGCGEGNQGEVERNNREFLEAVKGINAITARNDDYAENLWGGLKQAMRDARGCSDNLKLMFIIGDAGYDPNMQRQRGIRPVELEALVRNVEQQNMALFFIRPPMNKSNTNPAYIDSWISFRTQALDLLKKTTLQGDDPERYFFDLNENNGDATVDVIVTRVDRLSRPEVSNEIELDISGGSSLVDAIERLQAGGDDVPVLLWRLIRKGACKNGPDQCDTRMIQDVRELYVPVSDKVQEDIWLVDKDFTIWQSILGSLRADVPGREKRQTLVNTLITSLENTLNVSYRDVAKTGETFGEFVSRVKGLPVKLRSPLMQYSPDELLDPTIIPLCEIESLIDWVKKSVELLTIVRTGYNKPEFEVLPPVGCNDMSEKGQRIPFIPVISTSPLGPNKKYSYGQTSGGERRYWVPEEFMP